jgi:hypothetical protein
MHDRHPGAHYWMAPDGFFNCAATYLGDAENQRGIALVGLPFAEGGSQLVMCRVVFCDYD